MSKIILIPWDHCNASSECVKFIEKLQKDATCSVFIETESTLDERIENLANCCCGFGALLFNPLAKQLAFCRSLKKAGIEPKPLEDHGSISREDQARETQMCSTIRSNAINNPDSYTVAIIGALHISKIKQQFSSAKIFVFKPDHDIQKLTSLFPFLVSSDTCFDDAKTALSTLQTTTARFPKASNVRKRD